MDKFSAFSSFPDSSSDPLPISQVERQLFDAMNDQSPDPDLSETPRLQTTTTSLQPADCVDGSIQGLLKDTLRKAQEWENHHPIDAVERHLASQLRTLVENLTSAGSPSILAMCKVRTLLRNNCRQLKATQEQCDGLLLQPLDRCILLSN